MSTRELFFIAVPFVILTAITVATHFRWLKPGRTMTVLVFLAGVAMIVSLRIAEIPPDWFDGSKTGFGMVLWLTLSAFVMHSVEERAFGYPLLMGMGLTLLAANVVEVVAGWL